MNILEELEQRGILKQISNKEKFLKLKPEDTGVYAGFDPTAQSLHLGNYIQIVILKHFQNYGFNTIALVGGATGMIGDPSFKDSERALLSNKDVLSNKNLIIKQLKGFGLTVKDNYDFYKSMSVLDFLREAGKLINVSYMMAKESVTKRIERGLSFTEFSYQILQGYDFLTLYQKYNVKVQVGGSDQWGNITTGLDMISKVKNNNHEAVAITVDLLTDENGKKIGKSTGGGALWLDKNMCSPYNMYQYLLNQPDSMVEKLLKWLSFLSLEKIKEIIKIHSKAPFKHYGQKLLAQNIVRDIFGQKELSYAEKITEILFNKNFDTNSLKTGEIKKIESYLPVVQLKLGENIVDKLIENKIISSKREAREFIQTKALKIDGQEIDENTKYQPKKFAKKYSFFKKGKKKTILLKTLELP